MLQSHEPHFQSQSSLVMCGSWLLYWIEHIQNTKNITHTHTHKITERFIGQHWYWGELRGYCSSLGGNNKNRNTSSGNRACVTSFLFRALFWLASHWSIQLKSAVESSLSLSVCACLIHTYFLLLISGVSKLSLQLKTTKEKLTPYFL